MKCSITFYLTGGFIGLFLLLNTQSASAVVVYNSIPDPQPYALPSQPYQAQQTAEFGDFIGLAGTDRRLTSVKVGLELWMLHSQFPSLDPSYWTHPLTLNIYSANTSGAAPITDNLLVSKTITPQIPWRPENQGAGNKWLAPNNVEYNSMLYIQEFDFTGDPPVDLPDQIVLGLAFDTQTYGQNPTGVNGPYNSLNFAVDTGGLQPTVGTDLNSDAVFWNTLTAGYYSDGGTAGVGIFRQDTGWSGYIPLFEVNATVANPPAPEPAGIVLVASGLLALSFKRRTRRER